jgi:hypothetical protein
MIPFAMIVRDELGDRAPDVTLPQRHDPVQTFFLDRPDESFRVGIRRRGALRHITTRIPAWSNWRRTARLQFRSRSPISTRCPTGKPSSADVARRTM